jgi:hypothetical protein
MEALGLTRTLNEREEDFDAVRVGAPERVGLRENRELREGSAGATTARPRAPPSTRIHKTLKYHITTVKPVHITELRIESG